MVEKNRKIKMICNNNFYYVITMRCNHCKKKMGVMEYECKCKKKFCAACRLPESHNCTYDFKTNNKLKLMKELVKIEPAKIIKI